MRPRAIPDSCRSSCAVCAAASASSGGVFDVAGRRGRLESLAREVERPDLWEKREEAERILREKTALEAELARWDRIETGLSDAEVLLELAGEAGDESTYREAEDKLAQVDGELADAELRTLLAGENDGANAIVSINSGAGGTDAADWAEMLMRMYLRWAERRGYGCELLDSQPGDEAGIRSATFVVSGERAYGYLKAEEGVHRLVRISPFDANARRHTAFASVAVLPEIDDTVEVEIDEKDLRIDTFRAGGKGGQHVNKTESAVRITHLPTGIVVQCQNERSQHKNRSSAMKVLRARLFERARAEREAELDKLRGLQRKIDFGSQIRSYTLHPQQRVKDHRSELELGNVDAVLDGDLDRLIRAGLIWRADSQGKAA
jgi:peptide chain release factor 2